MMGYPGKLKFKLPINLRQVVQNAQALSGARSEAAPEKQAVTFEAAAQMGHLTLRSARVSATPTADQHNALVEDMHALAAILNKMGAKITGF